MIGTSNPADVTTPATGGCWAARLLDSSWCARYYPTVVIAQLMDVFRFPYDLEDCPYSSASANWLSDFRYRLYYRLRNPSDS